MGGVGGERASGAWTISGASFSLEMGSFLPRQGRVN